MSKGQLKDQVIENMISPNTTACVITHFHAILTGKLFYGFMFVIQDDF